jgi:hypothetical protein
MSKILRKKKKEAGKSLREGKEATERIGQTAHIR